MSRTDSQPVEPKAIQTKPVHAGVTDALRSDILHGVVGPGERLIELQLVARYGASRAAIRAAIAELVNEGLVDHEANRGATVRRVAIDEAVQITEVRGLLEGLIAARAATMATAEDRADLASIGQLMRSAVAADRSVEYSDLNNRLHRRLREISGHHVAAELVGELRNRAAHHAVRLASIPGRPDVSLGQHAAIINAVIAGDSEAAQEAMRTHLESVASMLRHWARTEQARPIAR